MSKTADPHAFQPSKVHILHAESVRESTLSPTTWSSDEPA